ncbi:MAG: bifunctional phosphoribosylaminoimidazolecarboxamide formyltransferase/IMP cyclohydrolase [Actinomycetota bacterium]|nr:bifunctional phosphoribosylaminoimidazolecarboxamide formyltransferase/IMP cyclohydrolase [Actinomycetota bacterium]
MVKRALLSVSDKTGIVEFGRGLADAGVELISSGGTARALAEAGVEVKKVSEVTGAPEILGGRVKTLHPKIHGGILADRRRPEHLAELKEHDIEPIDLVVCNLYPFARTIASPDVTEDDAVEQIDIGGPAMVRASAKNFHSVCVVVNPTRYDEVLAQVTRSGEVPERLRRELALEAFSHTASYDAAVASYLGADEDWPEITVVSAKKALDLRYGENPHQSAAFYVTSSPPSGVAAAEQLHGKELSYNNFLDTDAAWKLALELEGPGAAIIKHSNPCGVAIGSDVAEAYAKALECDPTSAFGGIVALNQTCSRAAAEAVAEIFTEVIIAPDFEPEALAVLQSKKNLRILRGGLPPGPEAEIRRVSGGLLMQSPDPVDRAEDAKVVTKTEPTPEQWQDLRFAWVVAKHVKSNAIVFATDLAAVGVGAGQMSRVEATELAAKRSGGRATGAACASDAFFPFRDGLDAAVAAGAAAVIQPGGSVRDDEVIQAADEHGIPMVFTGRRHFRH